MKNAQQPVTPSNSSAGCIDAVIPVVLDVAIAATTLLGRRLAKKSPESRCELASSGRCADLGGTLSPPFAHCSEKFRPFLVRGHSQDGIACPISGGRTSTL